MTPPVSGGVPEQGLREPEGTLNRRLKRIADEMPALRDFIRAEHGPIGWEHTLSIWVTDLQKIVAALERPRPALPAPGAPTGDAVLDLLESAAKALRDVTVFTKGGGSLMRELLADGDRIAKNCYRIAKKCDRIAKKCEMAVWGATMARREGDLEVGEVRAALPAEPDDNDASRPDPETP